MRFWRNAYDMANLGQMGLAYNVKNPDNYEYVLFRFVI